MTKTLKVILWGEEIGRLAWDERRKRSYFIYNPEWLKKGLNISPLVAPIDGARGLMPVWGEDARIYQKLPAFVADSLPDAWGNQLFDLWRLQNHLSNADITPLDKLSFIGKRGMGALEYQPLLAEIDGKERKFVIGKNKEEFALIEKTGISKPYSRPAASNGREIVIREATKAQASDIAQLIMMAMTDDCCQHFCGVGHGLEDFLKMMTSLVEREDSQYSYRNTFVAMADNKVVGIAVSYEGGRLHELRQAFIKAAKEYIGKDHSGMDDETQAGELYLDSLAVLPEYRRQGIAHCLLHATKEKANKMGQPCVGLLVDKGNPAGEALYASVGFQYANDSWWGGHPMKHLVLK